jgi:hypothetical protein
MTRTLRLTIGDYKFIAELHIEDAPETSEMILAALPLEGWVIQARWSGEAVWFPMDEFGMEAPQENSTIHPSKGDLLYYPGGISEKEMLIPYGSSVFGSKVGHLRGNHFATIVEGSDKLREMGEKTLWEGAQRILIEEA